MYDFIVVGAGPAGSRFSRQAARAGHVDATAEVVDVEQVGDDWEFTFSLPETVARYVVEKGSIAVDGISLTVADLRNDASPWL